jgi:hypothetical protein
MRLETARGESLATGALMDEHDGTIKPRVARSAFLVIHPVRRLPALTPPSLRRV